MNWNKLKPLPEEMKLCNSWNSEKDRRSGIGMYAVRIGVKKEIAEYYMVCGIQDRIPEGLS